MVYRDNCVSYRGCPRVRRRNPCRSSHTARISRQKGMSCASSRMDGGGGGGGIDDDDSIVALPSAPLDASDVVVDEFDVVDLCVSASEAFAIVDMVLATDMLTLSRRSLISVSFSTMRPRYVR